MQNKCECTSELRDGETLRRRGSPSCFKWHKSSLHRKKNRKPFVFLQQNIRSSFCFCSSKFL